MSATSNVPCRSSATRSRARRYPARSLDRSTRHAASPAGHASSARAERRPSARHALGVMRPSGPGMSPEELGKYLRQARRRMGWDLDRLHGATGIPRPYIEALEEGHLEALPALAHVRGYVRSYAEALRLNGDDLALDVSRWLEDNPLPSSRRVDRSRLLT